MINQRNEVTNKLQGKDLQQMDIKNGIMKGVKNLLRRC
jgi:hypothetical protein